MNSLAKWITEDVEQGNTEDVVKNLGLLQGRIARLDRLLNDLLQYSRVGKENASKELFSVTQKAKAVFESLKQSETTTLKLRGPDVWVKDYDVSFEILISNLIGNAIKHNDKDVTQIDVSLEAQAGGLALTVEDNGPGIDAAYREKIFDVFSTIQARDKVEASGMGLAIVKKIVDIKDGRVAVGKSALGGSKFSIWLNTPTLEGKSA